MLLTEVAGLERKSALNVLVFVVVFLVLLRRKEMELEGGGVKVPWAQATLRDGR